jgi:hypothetical protein
LVNVADLAGGLGVVGEVDEVDADLARERVGVVGAALSLSEETREGGWALFQVERWWTTKQSAPR